ncbi:structural maintenance of chromosomes protein 6 [Trichosurus vulpecula]|uniref:structural maintenance of chromosomes protein 6 n=1 Tax=Trichosurus vulpecula TaxID=9337 RepID=UPI00186B025F|nr:structural maintenance of chromosomes protein 6 [Trichosurus vulpecula]XP_036604508.1 structural maintenance of chromosomes protein 6 [Trichosurus vulpecula]XP_036604509.1 structural maintenance of chromosomes protein 6 [Trichosurus vulpecula]
MAKRKEDHFVPTGTQKKQRHEQARRSAEDSEEDEVEELSLSLSPGNSAAQSMSAEVGIIESIQLKNFMCHSMLGPFKFGSNVNFVVGNNGSGKSAVLTALIVGLGGKATATNRGSSLKGFVKDGQSSADVSITLRNRGEDAFKPNVYGDAITVHQHISVEGSRTYKLKGQTGNLVSAKKEELIAILDHFNIQVDNPVSVLTQEMSKQFLQSKNEGDKYKFFMKATQLEQMKEDYSYIMDTKARTRDQIEQGEERLHELRRQCLEKEERFQSIADLSVMRKKLEDLKQEMAWALVGEYEKEIEEMKSDVSVGEQRTARLTQKLEEWQAKVNVAEEKFKAIQDNLEKISEEAIALEPKCIQAKEDLINKKKAYNDAEVLHNRCRSEFRGLERDGEQLRNRIAELKRSADQRLEPARQERQKKIAALKEKIESCQDQEDLLGREIERFQQTIEKDKEERSKILQEVADVQQFLNTKRKHLHHLKETRTNRLKQFGSQVPALLEAIDEAYKKGQFTRKPVGPLGACIRLRDPELALAIECCLKGLIFAFCCHNYKDERVLQGLMKKLYPPASSRPQIIVSEFRNEVYDVTRRAAYHPEFPTVLTALEIDNAVVANSLIDMRRIETVLLIKSSPLARAVMQSQKPPKNCSEAFTAEGDQVFERRYYSSERTRPRYLTGDVEKEISHLEKEVESRVSQLATLEQHVRSLESDLRKNQELVASHHRHLKELKIKARKIALEIRNLENEEENQSVDISTLEEEDEEIKKQMQEVEEEMKARKEEMENLRKQKTDAEQTYEDFKLKIHQVSELAEPVKEELNQAYAEVDTQKRSLRHYEERLKQHVDTLQAKKEELAKIERELVEKTALAKKICPERIEVKKTPSVLDKEITRLRQKIQTESDSHGDREEIIRQYKEAKETYQDLDGKVKSLKKFIKLLDEIMTQRYKTYQQFRRCLTLRCKLYFDNLLSQRAYSGKMLFDHKNETLAITVQPGEGSQAAFSDMRSLSGGERSFSTVCFILSLWSITESPFRCLDEFDVYMDMVNRRIAMDMILKMADSQHYRQFILLTPQNMGSLPPSRLIRILRMRDPERGQRALPFQAANKDQEEDQS